MATAEQLDVIINAKIEAAMRDLKSFNKQMGMTEKSSNSLAKSLLKKFGAAAVAAKSVQMIVKFTRESAQAASDAEEVFSKFATVFADVSTEASDAAAQLANDFGLASSTAQKLVGDTGDLLTGFGLTGEAALQAADETNRLALDLASFTNAQGGAEAVSRALTSAYSGEREALKTYGIVISEAAVQAKILEQAQSGLTFETEQQAKIAATLAIAQEQSKNAIGDYARTADSAANVQRTLGEQTKELKENYGALVLDGLTPVRMAFRDLLTVVNDSISKYNTLKGTIAELDSGGQASSSIASLNEQLLYAQQRLDELSASKSFLGSASRAELESLEEIIPAIEREIEAKRRKQAADEEAQRWIEKGRVSSEAAAEVEAKLQEQRDKAAEENAKHLEALNDAFEDTKAGQIAATEELIAYFETFKEGPKSIAVLEMLNEKLKELNAKEETAKEFKVDSTESWLEQEQRKLDWLVFISEEEERLRKFSEAQETAKLQNLESKYESYAQSIGVAFDAIGQTLKETGDIGEAIWQGIKEAGKEAVATLLTSLAQEAIARAALAAASLNFVQAGAYTAAAGAAYGAASTVRAFRSGGVVNEPVVGTGQRTGQQYSFGEAGPEMVSPTSGGGGGDDLHVTINLDGQVISKFVTKAIRSNRILVDSRAVV